MNIYFSGIGGVGIGALASIAHSAGYKVFGSDQNSSLMTEELLKKDVEIEIGKQDGSFLKSKFINDGVDWLPISISTSFFRSSSVLKLEF